MSGGQGTRQLVTVDRDEPPPGGAATAGTGRRSSLRYALGYAAAVALLLGLVVLLVVWGSRTTGSNASGGEAHDDHAVLGALEPAGHFLLVVALVITLSQLAGRAAVRVGQPPVVGELAAGLLVGPIALGAVAPGLFGWLFSPSVVSATGMTAQLGLVAFMFLMGTELDFDALRGHGRTAATVSLAGMAIPFLGGLLLAVPLFDGYAGTTAGFVPFALFVALALSITALPVLARILADRGAVATPTGALALVCAATGDVVAWGALALVLAFAGASGFGAVGATVVLSAAFVAVMLLVVRPMLTALVARAVRSRAARTSLLPVLLAGALLAAVTTQLIGVHAVFGAFVFGVVTPRHRLVRELCGQVRVFTMAVLLPLFFVHIGLKTTLGSAGSATEIWLLFLAVLAVAVLAKLAAVGGAARASGLSWRDSANLGVLMNCRGLTELVVADIGLQLGVIDGTLFTVLVLMAAATTALTTPLLGLAERFRRGRPARDTSATTRRRASVARTDGRNVPVVAGQPPARTRP